MIYWIFGCLGLVLNIVFIIIAPQLYKKGETALIHLLLAIIFIFFLPIPLALYFKIHSSVMLTAALFGTFFIIMLIITMAFQTGHLAYRNRQANNDLWEDRDQWMIHGMLGDVYESISGVIFHLWHILLAVSFYTSGHHLMGTFFIIVSLIMIRSVILLGNHVLRNPSRLFKLFKPNAVFVNLESFLVFLVLVIWLIIT